MADRELQTPLLHPRPAAFRRHWRGAAWAIVATVLAAAIRWMLEPLLGDTTQYLLFYFSVIWVAVFCGMWPAILAILLGALAGTLLYIHLGHLTVWEPAQITSLTLFVLFSVATTALAERLHRTRENAMNRAAALELNERRLSSASAALQESESKFRVFFEQAAVGMGRVSFKDARWIDVNRAFCRMLGYSAAELLATPWPQITHPDDVDVDLVPFRQMAAGQLDTYSVEKRFLHKQGHHVWARLTLSLVRDAQGRPDHEIAVIENISDRKDAEEALRRNEQRLRAIFDHAGVGIVEVEGNDHFVAANNRACEILGRTRQQVLSMDVHELTWPEDRALSDRYNSEVHAGLLARADYEKRYVRGDGTPVWAHVTVSPVLDAQGRWARSITTIQDITAQKQAQEQLIAAQKMAEQSKAAAESANQAKDHFLAVLSHELRTPLTPVLAAVALIESDMHEGCPIREPLEMIRRNVQLEAKLIDDLLDLTRIARGKIVLDKQPLSLPQVLQHVVDICRADIEAAGLKFSMACAAGPGRLVCGDLARLQQVFWNVLKNAVKFTPAGGSIRVRCDWDGKDQVIAEIADTGVGIEPEALPKIFDAFEQAGHTVTRQFGGLGLGLAISKRLVEMHGGTIEAYSAGSGTGATFTIRLPTTRGATPANSDPPAGTQPQSTAAAKPLRILLVEDHDDTARIMCRLLESRGHKVRTAAAAEAALAELAQSEFDLLISDLGLPQRSGIELMQQMRRDGVQLPGIALSGYGQEEDLKRSEEAGFAEHLTKPVNFHVLEDAIQRVMKAA